MKIKWTQDSVLDLVAVNEDQTISTAPREPYLVRAGDEMQVDVMDYWQGVVAFALPDDTYLFNVHEHLFTIIQGENEYVKLLEEFRRDHP